MLNRTFCLTLCLGVLTSSFLLAQDEPATEPPADTATESSETSETIKNTTDEVVDSVKETTKEAGEYIGKKTEQAQETINKNEDAKKFSAGILQPIYALAEAFNFAAFHWLAFTFMVSGVVSYALQLVLGKLVVLSRGGFSVGEILGDAHGLVVSIVGLFLTTQAATENSTFTTNPAAVISATLVGAVIGFIFYVWAQSAELQAVKGRRLEALQGKK